MNRRTGWLALASTVLLALTGVVPAAATAIEDEGLWYFDWFRVQDAHDEGITGEGVTIAMIDSPVNLDIPTLADADIRVEGPQCHLEGGDPVSGVSTDFAVANHGTNVLSLLVGSGEGFAGQTGIKGLAPGATVLTYNVSGYDGESFDGPLRTYVCPDATVLINDTLPTTPDTLAVSMHAAMDAGADIISISLTGAGSVDLNEAVARAVRENVIVVSAGPNTGDHGTGHMPGLANGVVTVDVSTPEGEVDRKESTDVVAPGSSILFQGREVDGAPPDWELQELASGRSFATPIVAGNLALAMQKYPDATPNQILQSLIRNTGAEPHELNYEHGVGYGLVITDVFLAADPTEYPDVNPFVSNFSDLSPTVSRIWEGAVVSEESEWGVARPLPVYTPDPSLTAPGSSSAEPTTSPESGPSPTPTGASTDEPSEDTLGWLVPAIVVGVLLVIALGVIVAVVVIRTNRAGGGTHGQL